jgi:hypothetical protein
MGKKASRHCKVNYNTSINWISKQTRPCVHVSLEDILIHRFGLTIATFFITYFFSSLVQMYIAA